MRGVSMDVDPAGVRPVKTSSDSPWGRLAEVATILSASVSSAMLTTNSLLSRMFRAVSFGRPTALFPGANATIGGLEPKQLKNEKGAALTAPSLSTVVIHAIGLGVTRLASTL